MNDRNDRSGASDPFFRQAADYARKRQFIRPGEETVAALPGNAWFLSDTEILALPRDEGESRYVYNQGGLNLWAYASGHLYCNDGMLTILFRSEEGQEPRLAWFAGMENAGETAFVPLLSVPEQRDGVRRFTVFHPAYVTYITEWEGLRFSIRVFVAGESDLRFTVGVENTGEETRRFFLSDYMNPFLLHAVYESGEDRWFKETWLEDGTEGIPPALPSFALRCKENISRTVQLSNYGVLARTLSLNGGRLLSHQETTSRREYVGGAHGSLHRPYGVAAGRFPEGRRVTTFTDVAVFGDILHMELPAGGTARLDMRLTYAVHCDGEEPLKEVLRQPFSPAETDALLRRKCEAERAAGRGLALRFGGGLHTPLSGERLNPFFTHLKRQVEFCALLKGYAQQGGGSLIGVRDVMQALEAYLIWQPAAAREKIIEVLGFTDPSGRCPRQYSLPAYEGAVPAMDLRPFIDQGVWVISTIVSYLKFTGDFSLLGETCGYYEIVDEAARQARKSGEADSVLEHMLRIMDYLLQNTDEETGCTRVLFGDWNDALDGLGVSPVPGETYGNGVSVMAAAQVWQNLQEMAELLPRVDAERYASLVERYRRAANRLEEGLRQYGIVRKGETQRIAHGWGHDRQYYVGSFCDADGCSRRSLTSNAFWALSGLLGRDLSLRETIHEDILRLDSVYGLRTFDPPFGEDASGVGRINKLPEGTAENGAVYIHASVFGIMALFRSGYPEDAWRLLEKALPFTHRRLSLSPFVMPNSYGCNPEKFIDGESMNDWQTGSANVVLKLLVRYVVGIQPEYDGLWLQTAASCPFDRFEAALSVRGRKLALRYVRTGRNERRYVVNGEVVRGKWNEEMRNTVAWIPNAMLAGGTGDSVEILVED